MVGGCRDWEGIRGVGGVSRWWKGRKLREVQRIVVVVSLVVVIVVVIAVVIFAVIVVSSSLL